MEKLNIMIILADDLGYGDINCYQKNGDPTPHLDALAENGLRFTDAHAMTAVCTPSRYNLLTGRYAWRSGSSKASFGNGMRHCLRRGAPPLLTFCVVMTIRPIALVNGIWVGGTRKDGSMAYEHCRFASMVSKIRPGENCQWEIDFRAPSAAVPCIAVLIRISASMFLTCALRLV